MVNKEEKIKKFYEVVSKMQIPPGREIGLIISKKKKVLADISKQAPDSNMITVFELDKETNVEKAIDDLADAMSTGRTALLQIHDYLDQKIFNQLYLLSKDGRMQYAKLEDWVTVDAVPEASIILISTEKELENLNYTNIMDMVGPVLRI